QLVEREYTYEPTVKKWREAFELWNCQQIAPTKEDAR
ncbi:unnamed protein product, partial [marine sediment metagenome]